MSRHEGFAVETGHSSREQTLASDRIQIQPRAFSEDDLRRRILLTVNMNRVVQHIWAAIRFENTDRLEPVFDTQRPILSTAEMRPWFTSRPNHPTRHSHINVAVFDSTWEASEAYSLDTSYHVDAWVKNDHLGFEIPYLFRGVRRKYRPDFLVRLRNGTTLVVEVKGEVSDESEAKRRFLEEWIGAVNQSRQFGLWTSGLANQPGGVTDVIECAITTQVNPNAS